MKLYSPPPIPASEITPKDSFENRRAFLQQAGFMVAGSIALLNQPLSAAESAKASPIAQPLVAGKKITQYKKTAFGKEEKLTSYEDVTTYNNFYEFGTDKSDPAKHAKLFKTHPWAVSIEGEVKSPRIISLEDIVKLAPLEERIYRMRCVEGWSMVIPWLGIPLAKLIQWAEPTGNAKFIEFVTLDDKQQMPGQNLPILDWPYVEGLRMDEAMHPLTILAVGLYGEQLPNQNGAPLRLVVPWKYGFKGAKSIVKIRFTEKMPRTSWMKAGPREYGFYANVNPQVDHPRWSQSSERRIGAGIFAGRIKTQMFNGYAEQVGQMYAGLDLQKNF
ncbi:MAG TPA: protein-methionine-sulfoxide reductase catalytic subunit MsrP [Methylophilaceae bacterium]|nr:protein-methionine-sulfoxide reductase catalytic subunit MsrP [Methylophilaceae bacterium]